jgi:hypothetical protein
MTRQSPGEDPPDDMRGLLHPGISRADTGLAQELKPQPQARMRRSRAMRGYRE